MIPSCTISPPALKGQLHDRFKHDFGLLFQRYLRKTMKQRIKKKYNKNSYHVCFVD